MNALRKSEAGIENFPCIKAMPDEGHQKGNEDTPSKSQRQVIVLLRHGKTSHNKLGLFTGWTDSPLNSEGKCQAKEAGQLLKEHGFKFDVVYTSWLTRAIETAMLCLDEMDLLWLPVITSWRLNERMYGALTGVSKRFVAQKFGDVQLKKWRKGFKVRPPPVSSFSPHYPGNDKRYNRYLNDIRVSFSESIIRSIESKKIVVSQKFPKTESLHDCMKRTIPYYTDQIVPEAVDKGKRVLIASSENAIRGLLMHLMDIPEEKINKLEIPNGLPLIYDVKSRCIKLLDDGSTEDPLSKHNFGESADYLFRPCLIDYDDEDECMITDYMWNSWDEQADLPESKEIAKV
uniref:phosphoglycerate mutase (2,3-diphosphoglycerate-dependent) n=1 Tax=Proboscia inermis TaxID=420281 RepID=A0A7S0CGA8_9STRA